MAKAANSYDKIRNRLRTGDIVLFSSGGVFGSAIQLITRSKWSHVGMVVRVPEWDFVLLWESVLARDMVDLHTGKVKQGVRLTALSDSLTKYDCDIAVRRLSPCLDAKQIKDLQSFREQMKNRPYEKRYLELMKSAYDGVGGNNQECLSSVFCSELVAESYQVMGILPDHTPSNEYTPADFSSARSHVLQLKEHKLGREEYIKRA